MIGRFQVWFVVVAWGLCPAMVAWAQPTVAVFDLANNTGDRALEGVGVGVANVVVSRFAQTDVVQVVERQQLRAVLDEVALSTSGAVDPQAAIEAGRLLGAEYLVVGDLFSFARPELTVHLRVVDATDGRVLVSDEVTSEVGARGESMFVLIDLLAFRILDALEVELKAAEQIELRQVDVREMATLGAYGLALEALDSGRAGEARSLLDQALALEPEFGLARSTLADLATDVRRERVAVASDVWTDVQAYWDALDERTQHETHEPTPQHLADLAIQARLAALRGDLARYHALEEERATRFQAWWDAQDGRWAYLHGPTAPLQGALASRLGTRGEDHPGNRPFASIQHYPWEIRMQRAILYLLSGDRARAQAMIEDAYRHPGPVEPTRPSEPWAGPAFPDERFEQWGLFDAAVVATQQQVALAELAGDEDERRRLLPILEERIAEARDARADREVIAGLARKLERKRRANAGLVEEEVAVLERFGSAIDLREPAYRAFLSRFEDGFYRPVRNTPELEELARGWQQRMADHWTQPLGVVRRLEAMLALHEQLGQPKRSDQQGRNARRAEIQALLDEAFQ